jgi:hypothetical protein
VGSNPTAPTIGGMRTREVGSRSDQREQQAAAGSARRAKPRKGRSNPTAPTIGGMRTREVGSRSDQREQQAAAGSARRAKPRKGRSNLTNGARLY